MAGRKNGDLDHRNQIILKYIGAVVILGIVEGSVTYFYLNQVCYSTLLGGVVNDPISLVPYIFLMALLALVTVYLLVQSNSFNAALFLVFILIWLLTGFAFYFFSPQAGCVPLIK